MPDIKAAVEFYTTKLGFGLDFTWGDPVEYAGVNFGGTPVVYFFKGTPDPQSAQVELRIENVDDLFAFHRDNGVDIVAAPVDQPYGLRDYKIRDQHGYRLGFSQQAPRREPALQIERVDVPVRLEKRLAALLADLAEHKKMDVSSCLEETLLHSFERVSGGGVASPHTEATLKFIEGLKAKHGIEYDAHASYRFVEKSSKH